MTKPTTKILDNLHWRNIGPPRGGRVVTVAGHRAQPHTFYFGAVAGGVWKTDDGGQFWRNISDGYLKTSSVGALAVAPSDPNVIYAGMGEACIRIDVSHGDGVYKSTDGGETWKHCGLSDTRHIGKIRVHPHNADIVYVAALGHAFGTNEERGVFRSKDGGETWEKVLYKSDKAGAIDLVIDDNNPRNVYASIYQVNRTFWSLTSGGEDSGLWKSTDGGDTWTDISRNPGLPEGVLGKIGVATAYNQPGRVWALIEAGKTGLYRSDNGGATWRLVCDNADLARRPWYYMHVHADPQDPNTVYVNNLRFWKSTDGGHTFGQISTRHGDNHDVWINPDNTKVMVQGNDGGAHVSFNGGNSWSTIYNQNTAQFYRLATDNQFPYRVYGTQQDNSSISVPSRVGNGAIAWGDCYAAGTGESGHLAIHPDNPDLVYVGAIGSSAGGGNALQKYNHKTKQLQLITIWPENNRGRGAGDWKYRFQWTYPIRISPHDSNVLYAAGNHLFRSTDEGQSWEILSPDLSRNDPETLVVSGGPLTKDTSGAENYATIFTFEESQHEPGVFWAGTDDGLVHISKDAGANWTEVTPPDLPYRTMIHTLEISPHDPATCYLACTRYKLDDFKPYLYKTNDYGATWELIVNGIPEDDFTRVLREDPAKRGLLYVGTESGIYISFNDGANWQRMGGNFPVVPVYDMQRKLDDLVVATHGRSFWIMDDVTHLHQIADEDRAQLCAPAPHVRMPEPMFRSFLTLFLDPNAPQKMYMISLGAAATIEPNFLETGAVEWINHDCGTDAPEGVPIYYYLPETPDEAISMTILDANGNEIRTFSSQKRDDADRQMRIPAKAGLNRFEWNMRYANAAKLDGAPMSMPGPIAKPGSYQARLTVGDDAQTVSFEIRKDPRIAASNEDLAAQFDLLMKIRDKTSDVANTVNKLRKVRSQVESWKERADSESELAALGGQVIEHLTKVEQTLVQAKGASFFDMSNAAKVADQLANLPSVVASADTYPTKQAIEAYEEYAEQADEAIADFEAIVAEGVPTLNAAIKSAEIPAIDL